MKPQYSIFDTDWMEVTVSMSLVITAKLVLSCSCWPQMRVRIGSALSYPCDAGLASSHTAVPLHRDVGLASTIRW